MNNFYLAQKKVYDAIVVGSGITGGWAAKELTERGLKTLMLERGRPVEHRTDYITEDMGDWEFKFRNRGDRRLFEAEYPKQSQCYAFGEATRHFFVNDKENPYTHDPDKPFTWIRGYHLGGRSLLWGRQCYRWSDLDFEANARDGFGVDWPIRYKDIAPWYDYVESFSGISGSVEGIPHLPDGKFLPPMEMNCAERHVKEHIEKAFPGRKLIIGRVAVLTVPHQGRERCHYCGPCHRGCSAGAYFSTLSSTLPAARATGKLTVRCNSIVHSIIYDEKKDRAAGVRVIDRETKETLEFYGKVIFLCASTLGSTQILLNSSTPRFPNGLANSSGVLGHYLMDHPYQAGATGEIHGYEDKYYSGNRPNGIYIPRFRNLDASSKNPNYLRGFGYQGGASREGWQRGIAMPGLGVEFKKQLRQPGQWVMWIGGWGEHLPRYENYVELDPVQKDQWGMPLLKIHCAWSDNENKMREDMAVSAAAMLEACGAKNINAFISENPPGLCIHEMGTARMGRDPKTSVLNAFNQCHDVPNVFVTDGAAMTSSACQNPSITYMALTARACDYAVKQMKRGKL
ncbi:MAG: GMC family oxidoreductase [candidate division KSB1 bacterium]|nr:GMC family oxidoreductase [candidate division KSB1 bacterium]MDZ7367831.1 GMC family oxidoreductase [candidate division KSB1 bacterium]MDZ7405507.1 GMC family oxidoreductase [candidate division KSB1 bacterium]